MMKRNPTSMPPELIDRPTLIQKIIRFLDTCRFEDDWLYLSGVGWFGVASLQGYQGRDPVTGHVTVVSAKRSPRFATDPNLDQHLNGRAPFKRVYPLGETELLQGDEPPEWAARLHIITPQELEPLASDVRASLLSGRECELPGLGRFVQRDKRHFREAEGGGLEREPVPTKHFAWRFSPEVNERVGKRPP
jgi:nucleoid DNA-binding protein